MSERLGDALLDLRTSDKGFNQGLRRAQTRAEGLGQVFDRTSARAMGVGTATARGAAQANQALQLQNHEMVILQAQLQDMFIGLQSGQSPFTVFAQQGGQMTSIFTGRTGVLGALKTVGAGLVTFLTNPLNLAVVGFGVAATAAQMAFRAMRGDARSVADGLEEIGEALDAVTDATQSAEASYSDLVATYGAGAAQAREILRLQRDIAHANALDAIAGSAEALAESGPLGRAAEVLDEIAWLQDQISRYGDLPGTVAGLELNLADDREQLSLLADEAGVTVDQFSLLVQQAEGLREAVTLDEQLATVTNFREQMELAFGSPINMTGVWREFYQNLLEAERQLLQIKSIDAAAGLRDATAQAQALTDELAGVARALSRLQSATISIDTRNAGIAAQVAALRAGAGEAAARAAGQVAERRAELSEALGSGDAIIREAANAELSRYVQAVNEEARLQGELDDLLDTGGGGGATSERLEGYAALVQRAREFIATQELEQRTLAMTEQEANALRYAQDFLNDAQREGIDLTPDQVAALRALAGQMAEVEAETSEFAETLEFRKDVVKGFFSDMRSGLRQGESFWDAFANAATRALDRIIDKILDEALDAIFEMNGAMGGGGGGGGILSWIGNALGAVFGGFHADGGLIPNGTFGIVGERGPEPVIATSSGAQVLPNAALRKMEGGGGTVTVYVAAEEGDMFRPVVRAEAEGVAVNVTKSGIRAYDQRLPDRVQSISRDSRRRG